MASASILLSPAGGSNEGHVQAKADTVLAQLRAHGLQLVEEAARTQGRGQLPIAVWNLETETLMEANHLYQQVFDIPTAAMTSGAMTPLRLLNTDAIFIHDDTLAEVLQTRDRYLRCKQVFLSGALHENTAMPFMCITLTGRLQSGDMQIVALPDTTGRVREVISIILAHRTKDVLPPPPSAPRLGAESASLAASISAPIPASYQTMSSYPLSRSSSFPFGHTFVPHSPPAQPSPPPPKAPTSTAPPNNPSPTEPSVSSGRRVSAKHRLPPQAADALTHWKPHTFKPAGGRVVQCDFCGTTVTPALRTGPRGQSTLCNRCGLQWAKKN